MSAPSINFLFRVEREEKENRTQANTTQPFPEFLPFFVLSKGSEPFMCELARAAFPLLTDGMLNGGGAQILFSSIFLFPISDQFLLKILLRISKTTNLPHIIENAKHVKKMRVDH